MASHQQKLWTGVWIGQIWTEAQNLNFFWLGTPNNQASPSLWDQKQIFTRFLTDMHMKVWIQSRDTLRGLKHMVRVWVKWMLQHDHKCKEAVFSPERKHSTPQCEQISSHLSPYSLHTGFMYSYMVEGSELLVWRFDATSEGACGVNCVNRLTTCLPQSPSWKARL